MAIDRYLLSISMASQTYFAHVIFYVLNFTLCTSRYKMETFLWRQIQFCLITTRFGYHHHKLNGLSVKIKQGQIVIHCDFEKPDDLGHNV